MDMLSLMRTLGGLGVVLGILAGALWLVRRYDLRLPGRAMATRERRLELVETLPIDTRRTIALVRRDGREHLVLIAPEGHLILENAIVPDAADTAAAAARRKARVEAASLPEMEHPPAVQSFATLIDTGDAMPPPELASQPRAHALITHLAQAGRASARTAARTLAWCGRNASHITRAARNVAERLMHIAAALPDRIARLRSRMAARWAARAAAAATARAAAAATAADRAAQMAQSAAQAATLAAAAARPRDPLPAIAPPLAHAAVPVAQAPPAPRPPSTAHIEGRSKRARMRRQRRTMRETQVA